MTAREICPYCRREEADDRDLNDDGEAQPGDELLCWRHYGTDHNCLCEMDALEMSRLFWSMIQELEEKIREMGRRRMTDDKARLERLLETLPSPFTADGLYLDPCEPPPTVWGIGSIVDPEGVYEINGEWDFVQDVGWCIAWGGPHYGCEPINKCYSTREAAVDADRKRRLIRLEDE